MRIYDEHGMRVTVETIPYKIGPGAWRLSSICIMDVEGRLVPLDAENARKLAKALKRVANAVEPK